ncbi:hypothetical protein GCM10010245_90790 [Streptomyces spectabilis]|uniref:Uncharacterized protein n=1 Tax=Streptomyces spectabilis TaxID=68270 RepID=A0A7W8F0V2_STRST|nr:hypothetical protein [Streptomyces spectabilis]GGV57706.1 hypothetical protein GCM10010245_90790 [Streptomyces spectabilis]
MSECAGGLIVASSDHLFDGCWGAGCGDDVSGDIGLVFGKRGAAKVTTQLSGLDGAGAFEGEGGEHGVFALA